MGYDDTAHIRKPGILANSEGCAKGVTANATSMPKRKPNKKKALKKRPSSKY